MGDLLTLAVLFWAGVAALVFWRATLGLLLFLAVFLGVPLGLFLLAFGGR